MSPSLAPGRDRFQELAAGDRPVVIRVRSQLAVETEPIEAYAALTGQTTDIDPSSHAFLLESAEKTASSDPNGAFRPTNEATTRHARYSFVGYDPAAVISVDPSGTTIQVLGPDRYDEILTPGTGDTLAQLRGVMTDIRRAGFEASSRQRLDGGLVGFLAYDAVYDLHLNEVGRERPDTRVPDAEYLLTTRTLVFDEVAGTAEIVFTPVLGPDDDPKQIYKQLQNEADRIETVLKKAPSPTPGGFSPTETTAGRQPAYEQAVKQTKEHVLDGDIYQGVISRTRTLSGEIDPLGLYTALREINPSPYMYLLDHGDRQIVGASPETLVSVRDDKVMANPIAGTSDRGSSPVEDRRLAGELLADEKERAEHTMLVDLARNDVRQVSVPGSVRVEEFMNVLKYSHVQHIESTVTGTLRPAADAFDAMRATFPAGTLSGAPKIRAMEIIDALEPTPRGVYGGGVGYFSWTGDADAAIVIRTATIEDDHQHEQRVTVQAGAGIVADSDPTAEYEETEAKMDGVLAALDQITEPEQEVRQ